MTVPTPSSDESTPLFSRRRIWLRDPRPEDVDPVDIARALSRINRFNGQTLGDVPYSVAQHSVLVSQLVPRRFALFGLLHDASEAYLGDVISPVKKIVGEPYLSLERRMMAAVAARFGFEMGEEAHGAVKEVDTRMLVTEARDLTTFDLEVAARPYDFTVKPVGHAAAEVMFLRRLSQLGG